MVAGVGGFGVHGLAGIGFAVGDVVGGVGLVAGLVEFDGVGAVGVLAGVVAGVDFAVAEVEDVAVAAFLAHVVVAVLEELGGEVADDLAEGAFGVGAFAEAVGAGAGGGVVDADVAGDFLAAVSGAGAMGADVGDGGDGLALGEGVDHGEGVVVVVELAFVPDVGDGVVGDVEVAAGIAHVVPGGALDAGDGGAHGEAVVIVLADGVGDFVAVEPHGVGLAAGDVVPVEEGVHFFPWSSDQWTSC